MKNNYVPESSCPFCNVNHDQALDPKGNNTPKIGDISVCSDCGGMSEFDTEWKLIPLTEETKSKLSQANLDLLQTLSKNFGVLKC